MTLHSTLSLLFLSITLVFGKFHPNSHGKVNQEMEGGKARIKDPDQTAAKIGEVSSQNVEGS